MAVRIIPFSNKSCECCDNVLVDAIVKVASHSFLCVFVYVLMNPTMLRGEHWKASLVLKTLSLCEERPILVFMHPKLDN